MLLSESAALYNNFVNYGFDLLKKYRFIMVDENGRDKKS
jgi:hypothetical protein